MNSIKIIAINYENEFIANFTFSNGKTYKIDHSHVKGQFFIDNLKVYYKLNSTKCNYLKDENIYYASTILNNNFIITNINAHAMEFSLTSKKMKIHFDTKYYFYLKYNKKISIALHPDFNLNLLSNKYTIYSHYDKNSNFKVFPSQNGESKYGVSLNFNTEDELNRFLKDFENACEISQDNKTKISENQSINIENSNDIALTEDINEIFSRNDINQTEQQKLLNCRLGQGIFRNELINHWKCCSLTGCTNYKFLIASHIKPWKNCNDKERLDPNNGLLLIPNIDKAFDLGYISFNDDGTVIISNLLTNTDIINLGLNLNQKITNLNSSHHHYLEYHRKFVLKQNNE